MCFSLDCPATKKLPKPGTTPRFHKHQNRWCSGPLPVRQQLWAAYGHDRERYYRSYQPNDEDFIFLQELGMQAFVYVEGRLLWRMRLESYWEAGARAIKSLGADLSGDRLIAGQSNIIFVSLDIEGLPRDRRQGISELGIAELHSHQLLSENESGITSFNYATKKRRGQKFVFGNTTRLSPTNLRSTLVDYFSKLRDQDPRCEIILLAHSITSDIRTLDDFRVPLETLPVTGIIDTRYLARDILGSRASLESVLTTLRIPLRPGLLHCAGNDAHYTLQAFLALLQTQYHDKFGQLERLARQEVPRPPWCSRGKTEDDSSDCLEVDTCLPSSLHWTEYLEGDTCLLSSPD